MAAVWHFWLLAVDELMRSKRCALVVVLLGAVPGHAHEWTVTNLHPAVATSSGAYGVSGGQQVGDVTFGDVSIGAGVSRASHRSNVTD